MGIRERLIRAIPQQITACNQDPAGQHLYIEQRQQIADAILKSGLIKDERVYPPAGKYYPVCRNCGQQLWLSNGERFSLAEVNLTKFKYCPNCGVRMKSKTD